MRVKKKSLQKHLIINLPSSFSEILMAAYLKKEYIKMSATSTCKKDQKMKRNVINSWCCLLRRIVLTSSFSVEAWTWKCHQCRNQVIGKACSPHFSPKIQKKKGHCYNKVLLTNNTLKVAHPISSSLLRLPDSSSNWNLEMLVFDERGKQEQPEKNSTPGFEPALH